MTTQPTQPSHPSGWYRDPKDMALLREWDGTKWTGLTKRIDSPAMPDTEPSLSETGNIRSLGKKPEGNTDKDKIRFSWILKTVISTLAIFAILVMFLVLVKYFISNAGSNNKSDTLATSTAQNYSSQSTGLPTINTLGVAKEIHFAIINYSSFGTTPGLITIDSNDTNRIIFSPMVNATGDDNAKIYSKAVSVGPGSTSNFAPLAIGETAKGSYGIGVDKPWCLIISHGGYYAKITSVNKDGADAVDMIVQETQPTCIAGR